jgi:hypothetical protein
MSRTLFIAAACGLLCLSACEKEKFPEPTPTPPAATAPAPSAAAAQAPTAATTAAGAPGATGTTAENIPVAADFEDEAEKSITKANYKAELSSLEAEIK